MGPEQRGERTSADLQHLVDRRLERAGGVAPSESHLAFLALLPRDCNGYGTIAMLTVLEFFAPDGSTPFAKWFAELDAAAAAKVTTAVSRMELVSSTTSQSLTRGKDYKQWKPQET